MRIEIKHKGLRKLYEKGETKGVQQKHVARLRLILTRIDAISDHMELARYPEFHYHPLEHDRAGQWSVYVQKNWSVVFVPKVDENGVPYLDEADYVDYH